MIATLSADRSLVEAGGPARRGDGARGKLQRYGAERINIIRSPIRAGHGAAGLDGETATELSATADPSPYGRRSRSTRGDAGRSASGRRGTGRTRVDRKWRRKSLERLDSRPEMAPRLARRSASPRPAVFDSRWKGQCESPVTPKAAHAGAERHPRTSSRGADRLHF